jgi:hypothetical protein
MPTSCRSYYDQRSIDQFILVSGPPLGPMTRFFISLLMSDNCWILKAGHPLWREGGSVVFSAIIPWPDSCRTHNHSFIVSSEAPPTLRARSLYLYPPARVAHLTPHWGSGFTLCCLLWPAGLQWWYYNLPPHGQMPVVHSSPTNTMYSCCDVSSQLPF